MRFAKFNLLLAVHPRRFHHHKQRFAILFDFRALMGGERIFDGEFVQAELLLDDMHKRRVGLPQPQPDKGVRIFNRFADIFEVNHFRLFVAPVHHTVNNHFLIPGGTLIG